MKKLRLPTVLTAEAKKKLKPKTFSLNCILTGPKDYDEGHNVSIEIIGDIKGAKFALGEACRIFVKSIQESGTDVKEQTYSN